MHPVPHFDEQADAGSDVSAVRRDPATGPEGVTESERGSLRATWTIGSANVRDHGGFEGLHSKLPSAAPGLRPELEQGGLPQQGSKGFGGVSFMADDIKRLVGIVRNLPSGLALAFEQNTKARDFDFDREVMDSIVKDFHLDFETPHGESAR